MKNNATRLSPEDKTNKTLSARKKRRNEYHEAYVHFISMADNVNNAAVACGKHNDNTPRS